MQFKDCTVTNGSIPIFVRRLHCAFVSPNAIAVILLALDASDRMQHCSIERNRCKFAGYSAVQSVPTCSWRLQCAASAYPPAQLAMRRLEGLQVTCMRQDPMHAPDALLPGSYGPMQAIGARPLKSCSRITFDATDDVKMDSPWSLVAQARPLGGHGRPCPVSSPSDWAYRPIEQRRPSAQPESIRFTDKTNQWQPADWTAARCALAPALLQGTRGIGQRQARRSQVPSVCGSSHTDKDSLASTRTGAESSKGSRPGQGDCRNSSTYQQSWQVQRHSFRRGQNPDSGGVAGR